MDIKSRKGYSPHPDDKLVDALGIFHNLTPVHHHLVIMMMVIIMMTGNDDDDCDFTITLL